MSGAALASQLQPAAGMHLRSRLARRGGGGEQRWLAGGRAAFFQCNKDHPHLISGSLVKLGKMKSASQVFSHLRFHRVFESDIPIHHGRQYMQSRDTFVTRL